MTITVDEKAIEDAVISEVADRLIADDDLYKRAEKAFDDKINAFFQEKADALVEAAITEAIKEGLDATYQPLDQFGRPTGEATSIRARFGELAQDYWQTKVSSSTGKPTTDNYRAVSRAEYVMMQACGEDFHKHLKREVVNTTAALKDGLRAELKRWVDSTLNGLFNVKSRGDQEASKS